MTRGGKFDLSPPVGTRIEYRCPVYNCRADATYMQKRDGSTGWVISPWNEEGRKSGGRYLGDLGEALGLGRGETIERLVIAVSQLGYWVGRSSSRPLPSMDEIEQWAAILPKTYAAFRYLTDHRSISRRVIRENLIGWDGRRLTFPMFRDDQLVAFKTRVPRAGKQMRSWPGQGREWPLYPEVDKSSDWVLLVAGELDALAGRTYGLPAVSLTLGAGSWSRVPVEDLRDRQVVVCFDNGEQSFARPLHAMLRREGIDTLRTRLTDLGLKTPKGDLSDYLRLGGSPDDIRSNARRYLVKRGKR